MGLIKRDSLMTLEYYSRVREEFRQQVIPHKQLRTVHIGPNVSLLFEDELTVRYQIQEILRLEKTFEQAGIDDELTTYNPLVPSGSNLKATMMIAFAEPDERSEGLTRLKGIEQCTWVQVDGFDKVFAIADEDLKRESESKTSAVHFLRFELSPAMIEALKLGDALGMGISHDEYDHAIEEIAPQTQTSLVMDLT